MKGQEGKRQMKDERNSSSRTKRGNKNKNRGNIRIMVVDP